MNSTGLLVSDTVIRLEPMYKNAVVDCDRKYRHYLKIFDWDIVYNLKAELEIAKRSYPTSTFFRIC